MQKYRGVTMIELIITLVVMGILVANLAVSLVTTSRTTGFSRRNIEANFLANARLQVIMLKRLSVGYTNLTSDPCVAGSPPAICTPLISYASANGFTVAIPSIVSGSGFKTITVSVSGAGTATSVGQIYNYAKT